MTAVSPTGSVSAPVRAARRGPRSAGLRALLRNRLAVVALAVLAVTVLLAVLAPLVAPYDPNAQDLLLRLRPPAWLNGGEASHPLGTDELGRDMLSRVIYGTRVSLLVGAGAALLAEVVGTTAGLASGYLGGWTDRILMRLADVQLAFPPSCWRSPWWASSARACGTSSWCSA